MSRLFSGGRARKANARLERLCLVISSAELIRVDPLPRILSVFHDRIPAPHRRRGMEHGPRTSQSLQSQDALEFGEWFAARTRRKRRRDFGPALQRSAAWDDGQWRARARSAPVPVVASLPASVRRSALFRPDRVSLP